MDFSSDFPASCDECALLLKKGEIKLFLLENGKDPLCVDVDTPKTREIIGNLYDQNDIDYDDVVKFVKGETIVVPASTFDAFLQVFGDNPRFSVNETREDFMGRAVHCKASFCIDMLNDVTLDVFNATTSAPKDKLGTMIRKILNILRESPVINIDDEDRIPFSGAQSSKLRDLGVTECTQTCDDKSGTNPPITYFLENLADDDKEFFPTLPIQNPPGQPGVRNLLPQEEPAAGPQDTNAMHKVTVYIGAQKEFAIEVLVKNPDDPQEVQSELDKTFRPIVKLERLDSGEYQTNDPFLAYFKGGSMRLDSCIGLVDKETGKSSDFSVSILYPSTSAILDDLLQSQAITPAQKQAIEGGKDFLLSNFVFNEDVCVMCYDEETGETIICHIGYPSKLFDFGFNLCEIFGNISDKKWSNVQKGKLGIKDLVRRSDRDASFIESTIKDKTKIKSLLDACEHGFPSEDMLREVFSLPTEPTEPAAAAAAEVKGHKLTVFVMGSEDFPIDINVNDPNDTQDVARALVEYIPALNKEYLRLEKLPSGNFNAHYPAFAFFENGILNLRTNFSGKNLTLSMIYPDIECIAGLLGFDATVVQNIKDGQKLLICAEPLIIQLSSANTGNRTACLMFNDSVTKGFFHVKLDTKLLETIMEIQVLHEEIKVKTIADSQFSSQRGKPGHPLLIEHSFKSTNVFPNILGFIYRKINPNDVKSSVYIYDFRHSAKNLAFEAVCIAKGFEIIDTLHESPGLLDKLFGTTDYAGASESAAAAAEVRPTQAKAPKDKGDKKSKRRK